MEGVLTDHVLCVEYFESGHQSSCQHIECVCSTVFLCELQFSASSDQNRDRTNPNRHYC